MVPGAPQGPAASARLARAYHVPRMTEYAAPSRGLSRETRAAGGVWPGGPGPGAASVARDARRDVGAERYFSLCSPPATGLLALHGRALGVLLQLRELETQTTDPSWPRLRGEPRTPALLFPSGGAHRRLRVQVERRPSIEAVHPMPTQAESSLGSNVPSAGRVGCSASCAEGRCAGRDKVRLPRGSAARHHNVAALAGDHRGTLARRSRSREPGRGRMGPAGIAATG